jgi:hypothetical protein
MAAFEGGPISSVAPTTTATALTSLTVGTSPAGHGVVGYKFMVDGPSGDEVLNVLRWTTRSGDARQFLSPVQLQPLPAFEGNPVPVVSRADFSGSGFSQAHQRGGREVGWVVPSSMAPLVEGLLADGEPLVYAYWDGVDKVAHATGLGELYGREVSFVDRLVSELLGALPRGAVLAVTADHGQVEVGARARPVANEVADRTRLMSGEARFRWLHARPGLAHVLHEATLARYGDEAWVATRDEVLEAGVFGGAPSQVACRRLGEVAIIPLGDAAYLDPGDGGDAKLVCRHGGLSRSEMLVPLLASAP